MAVISSVAMRASARRPRRGDRSMVVCTSILLVRIDRSAGRRGLVWLVLGPTPGELHGGQGDRDQDQGAAEGVLQERRDVEQGQQVSDDLEDDGADDGAEQLPVT